MAEGATWREYFAFEDAYDTQADAIETAIETARSRGFLAMEGPCGTGKTMAALAAASFLIRETDQYERAVVVTPVKQQLEQFVDDLRALNRGLEEPLAGLALVGKTDLCPYGREDLFPSGISTHERCDDLRENTAGLVKATDTSAGERASDSATERDDGSSEEQWWDPQRGADLARAARHDAEGFREETETPLVTAGARAPYGQGQPSAPESMADGDNTSPYCPFEADWYARDKGSPVGYTDGVDGVLTVEELLPKAVEFGTCPHRVLQTLLEDAEIAIGNYNHLFDRRTRKLTAPLLDESTFVIVDEAHRLEERVRDLLSDTIGRQSLRQARGDVQFLLRWARQDDAHERHVKKRLAEHDVPYSVVERTRQFYHDVQEWLTERTDRYFREEFDGYAGGGGEGEAETRGSASAQGPFPERDLEIPLRDPETDDPDELREWAIEQGYAGDFWRELGEIGGAVEAITDEIDGDRTPICTAVGTLLSAWWNRDHTTYFREIELEYAPTEQANLQYPWEGYYRPSLLLYNCIPSGELRQIFERLGGGLIMSATLEPIDVFREVTGLNELAADDDTADRPVIERTYDLQYPPENRASWIVDAAAFTYRNRGEPAVDNRNPTREQYAYALRQIARSDGNVLCCLPSYREARWAAERLREDLDKPVLLDESSSNAATTELRTAFFEGEDSVLVTSTRGTLTEGVDYDGDKLHTCAVVGIPLVNVASPRVRAVKHAYGHRFGEGNAFEYALTVPAVRRTRQAIGRVIRGPDERGVRILVGRRYTPDARHSVYEYFPAHTRDEFVQMEPMFLEAQLDAFWS